MPTLHERFADLAEDAPVGPTPPGIWAAGRRRARARRTGTALVVSAVVLCLAALAGVSERLSAGPGYADGAGSAPALPRSLHVPSRWLSDTGGHPPGRLSLLIPAKRGTWTGYRWGVVGVSAATGAYRFLDLPDYGSADSLSPDGRHVAYWTGTGSGSAEHLDGLAVYDTVTGRLDRWHPPAGQALRPNGLSWYGDGAVVFPTGRTTALLWRFGHDAPRPLAVRLSQEVGSAGSGGLYGAGPRQLLYLDPRRPAQVRHVTITNAPRTMSYPRAVSPSGRRLAVVHATSAGSRLYVADVPADGRVRLRPVASSLRWLSIEGWTDDTHLVVVSQVSPAGYDAEGTPAARYALESLDVTTGRSIRLVDLGAQGSGDVILASGLLGGPVRDFPAPPTPLDPRLEAGLALGVLLVGAASVVVWRRRVRA